MSRRFGTDILSVFSYLEVKYIYLWETIFKKRYPCQSSFTLIHRYLSISWYKEGALKSHIDTLLVEYIYYIGFKLSLYIVQFSFYRVLCDDYVL